MKYQSLIIFLNRRCSVGCATCNVKATPTNPAELSPLWLPDLFKRVGKEPLNFSGYILWTGGEPFASFSSLLSGLECAAKAGYQSEILTSGSEFHRFPHHLKELAAAFKPRIRISLDAEHQRQVPVSVIIEFIKEALSLNLEINFTLREIPGMEKASPRLAMEIIKEQLPQFYNMNSSRSRWLHVIPHFPIVPNVAQQKKNVNTQTSLICKMVLRDLVIGEDRMLYPCCGFFSLPTPQRPVVGDPLQLSQADIENFLAKHLFYGPCQNCIRRVLANPS